MVKSAQKSPVMSNSPTVSSSNILWSYALVASLLLLLLGFVAWLVFTGQPLHTWPLVALVTLGLLVVVGIAFAYRNIKSGHPHQPNYYSLFIMGVLWAPLGLALNNYPLSIMGFIFLAIGLKNKDKWKKTSWKDLSPEKKRFKLILVGLLGLLVLAGLIAYLGYSP